MKTRETGTRSMEGLFEERLGRCWCNPDLHTTSERKRVIPTNPPSSGLRRRGSLAVEVHDHGCRVGDPAIRTAATIQGARRSKGSVVASSLERFFRTSEEREGFVLFKHAGCRSSDLAWRSTGIGWLHIKGRFTGVSKLPGLVGFTVGYPSMWRSCAVCSKKIDATGFNGLRNGLPRLSSRFVGVLDVFGTSADGVHDLSALPQLAVRKSGTNGASEASSSLCLLHRASCESAMVEVDGRPARR